MPRIRAEHLADILTIAGFAISVVGYVGGAIEPHQRWIELFLMVSMSYWLWATLHDQDDFSNVNSYRSEPVGCPRSSVSTGTQYSLQQLKERLASVRLSGGRFFRDAGMMELVEDAVRLNHFDFAISTAKQISDLRQRDEALVVVIEGLLDTAQGDKAMAVASCLRTGRKRLRYGVAAAA